MRIGGGGRERGGLRRRAAARGGATCVVVWTVALVWPAVATPSPAPVPGAGVPLCRPDPDPPEYYAIDLVTTRNVPGTGYVRGTAGVTFLPSPFGVSIAADGSYTYDVHVRFERLKKPPAGVYVAWLTTPQVDRVVRVGPLDGAGRASGSVAWNGFLVVVTLEASDDPSAEGWSGPIAFRGMSRSGRMHTMIGHGPLQQENCAAWGYDD